MLELEEREAAYEVRANHISPNEFHWINANFSCQKEFFYSRIFFFGLKKKKGNE